jgi:M6 family metalloprotease-like protein
MTCRRLRGGLAVALALGLGPLAPAFSPQETQAPAGDLAGFRTVDQAVTTTVRKSLPGITTRPAAYFGAHVIEDSGKLVAADVEAGSPADAAGLRPGDVLANVAGKTLPGMDALRELFHGYSPGDTLDVRVRRRDAPADLKVTLGATSRPMTTVRQRPVLGIHASEDKDGVRVESVTPGLSAARAGLRKGDLIVKIDSLDLNHPEKLGAILAGRSVGDTVTLTVRRDGNTEEIALRLAADPATSGFGRGNFDKRGATLWNKDMYRLAVLLVEFADVQRNPKIPPAAWQAALFTQGSYTGTSATGQKVWGSMNDYYQAQSYGKFRVVGKVFDPVRVTGKRADYGTGSDRFALFTEVFDKVLARDGSEALNGYDGALFLYAGTQGPARRGSLYWPHRDTFRFQGHAVPYVICPEGGDRMESISLISHEFGHLLGLPDLYARPGSPSTEDAGVWCTMATGHGKDGKPLHFSAWCKERLGWLTPAVLDPRDKQKLILAPVDTSPRECYKVLLRQDGSEYLLLENRLARGWDRDLPGQGLLIWRVVDGWPRLEESHGVSGPAGPRVFLGAVPYPSAANNAFTPFTTPSSVSVGGGGLSVHISNIRRLTDGRITFYIGYEFL